jgi:protein SCO1
MLARRALQIVTGILLGLAVVALVVLLTPPPLAQVEWAGASAPPMAYPAPPLELADPDGNPVNLASFRGRTTVVFFGYTHCPDVCPATLLNLSRALDQLRPREADRLQVVFVSLDPERDTPERMRSWLANFHPSIVGLTGAQDDVWAQAAAWGVHAAITPVREADAEGDTGTAADRCSRPPRRPPARPRPRRPPRGAGRTRAPGSAGRLFRGPLHPPLRAGPPGPGGPFPRALPGA